MDNFDIFLYGKKSLCMSLDISVNVVKNPLIFSGFSFTTEFFFAATSNISYLEDLVLFIVYLMDWDSAYLWQFHLV